jgi:hypothetical protein
MKIILKDSFVFRLENQVDFICLDSPVRARMFKREIFAKLKKNTKQSFQVQKVDLF